MIYTKEIKKQKQNQVNSFSVRNKLNCGFREILQPQSVPYPQPDTKNFNSLFLLLHPTEEHKATYLRTLELRYKDRHTEA